MKKLLFLFLFTCNISAEDQTYDNIKDPNRRMRRFSTNVHHYMKLHLEFSDPDAADLNAADSTYFDGPIGKLIFIRKRTPQKNQKSIYFNASKALPNDLAKRVVYECAEAAQDRRREGKVFAENQIRFNSICPCDFYKNLTDKQLEDIKQGAQINID